jgi:hypothetical protein
MSAGDPRRGPFGPREVAERARAVVERRLLDLGYDVMRDDSATSGRFTVRSTTGGFEIYVSGASGWGYPFWTERRLQPAPDRFAAVVRFTNALSEAELYLIPTLDWLAPEAPLVNPKYEGLKSEPEYGVRLTEANHDALQRYQWDSRVGDLPGQPNGPEPEAGPLLREDR